MLAVAREGLVYSLLKFPCGQELSEGWGCQRGDLEPPVMYLLQKGRELAKNQV